MKYVQKKQKKKQKKQNKIEGLQGVRALKNNKGVPSPCRVENGGGGMIPPRIASIMVREGRILPVGLENARGG